MQLVNGCLTNCRQLDPNAFEYTMKEINGIFEDAEKFTCATFCESCLGFLTANLYWACRDSRYERVSVGVADQGLAGFLNFL